jgi:hypothetical protein
MRMKNYFHLLPHISADYKTRNKVGKRVQDDSFIRLNHKSVKSRPWPSVFSSGDPEVKALKLIGTFVRIQLLEFGRNYFSVFF